MKMFSFMRAAPIVFVNPTYQCHSNEKEGKIIHTVNKDLLFLIDQKPTILHYKGRSLNFGIPILRIRPKKRTYL